MACRLRMSIASCITRSTQRIPAPACRAKFPDTGHSVRKFCPADSGAFVPSITVRPAIATRHSGERNRKGANVMQKARPNSIRAAREATGLSREQAAVKAGISGTTLRIAERTGLITEQSAAKLAPVLGVKPAVLLGANAETRR